MFAVWQVIRDAWAMQFNHGDVANQQIVSGATIIAPVPEPGIVSLAALGLAFGFLRKTRRC